MKPAGINRLTKILLTVMGPAMAAETILEPHLLHKIDDIIMLGLVLVFGGWWYLRKIRDDIDRRELMLFLGLGIFTKATGVMMEVWRRETLGDDMVWATLLAGLLMAVILVHGESGKPAGEECCIQ